MLNKIYKIALTKSQVDNLIEFFQLNFIDNIRNDESIDNIEYLCDMCGIYQMLKDCARSDYNAE